MNGRTQKFMNVKLPPLFLNFAECPLDDTLNVILSTTSIKESSDSTEPNPSIPIEISASCNYVILHPDLLISATQISQTSYCARRPIVSSLVTNSNFNPDPSSTTHISRANVWGSLVHGIVQQSLKDGRWDSIAIAAKVDQLLKSPNGISEVFRLGISIEEAKREISLRTQGISNFGKRYFGKEPQVNPQSSSLAQGHLTILPA
jgi:DNA replication ATP-dependent helicase Dna2